MKIILRIYETLSSRPIWIIGVPEDKREKEGSLSKEIMPENFSNLGKETDIQIQKAQRVSKNMDPKRPN